MMRSLTTRDKSGVMLNTNFKFDAPIGFSAQDIIMKWAGLAKRVKLVDRMRAFPGVFRGHG